MQKLIEQCNKISTVYVLYLRYLNLKEVMHVCCVQFKWRLRSIAPGQNLFLILQAQLQRFHLETSHGPVNALQSRKGDALKELPGGKGERAVKLKIQKKISCKAREAISWLLPTVWQHGTRSHQTASLRVVQVTFIGSKQVTGTKGQPAASYWDLHS